MLCRAGRCHTHWTLIITIFIRHYHHNNDNRSKRSVDGHSEGVNMVASLIETEIKDVCSDVCPSGPPGPIGPVGPPGSVAKPPGSVIFTTCVLT